MLQVLQSDLEQPDKFVITLELVPGREPGGRAVDTVMGIARDAFSDGRISAVSMTDNPGGNPALSPDVLGHEIFKIGMDVIVHFTCRDTNRVGMESRALQLAMMGMKNILVLTGDYSGQGFGGQGAPVFDIDSVQLQILLSMLNDRLDAGGDPDHFFTGAAVSPFKYTEAESFAQYAKLCRKAAAGTQFVITQLGYDARKFAELIRIMNYLGLDLPLLGSVYLLTPRAARIMNRGSVPGAVVPDGLLHRVEREWRGHHTGREAAVERAAQLAAILKGLGYRGVHMGGIHRNFDMVGRVLDRMSIYEDRWQDLISELSFAPPNGFYAFEHQAATPAYRRRPHPLTLKEKLHFALLDGAHRQFFNRSHTCAPLMIKLCRYLDGTGTAGLVTGFSEDPIKYIMLNCKRCGDCGIQHVGFLCPESGCPKHMRNGACGGSRGGQCEVFADRPCIWVRAYGRLAHAGKTDQLVRECVPPRMWELDQSSAWLNFHLQRDHQGASSAIAQHCSLNSCSRLKQTL